MADAEALRPIGIHAERVKNKGDFREKAFVEHWQTKEADTTELLMRKQCARDDTRAVGYFIDSNTRYMRPLGPTTQRDRVIAETVIQWLGSNCGMAFLQSALQSIGGDIKWPPRPGTEIPEKDNLEKPAATVAEQPVQSVVLHDLINAVLFMQNGVCPDCGYLSAKVPMTAVDNRTPRLECGSCGFYINRSETFAIMDDAAQIRKLSVTALEKWRAMQDIKPPVDHKPPQPATVTTDRDKVLALLEELGCGSHTSTSGNSQYVAVTSPSKQGQPGVVFEFDRGSLTFKGMYGERT